jgi:hypothetical protein
MFPPLPENPFIDPAWRHLRATCLVAEGRQADHRRDDDRSREVWRLYRDLAGADSAGRAHLLGATPLGEACAFYAAAGPFKCAELEARLLARQMDEEIAGRMGLSAAAVAAFHHVYFCVRPRLEAQFYILNVAIGEKLHTGLTEGDRGLILKLFGYQQGPIVLDLLLDYWANPPQMPDDPGQLGPEAFAALATKLRLKALLTLLTARADAAFPHKYAIALELLEQLGVAERLRGQPPAAFRAPADAVARCWKVLEQVPAEDGSPPDCSGAALPSARRGEPVPAAA